MVAGSTGIKQLASLTHGTAGRPVQTFKFLVYWKIKPSMSNSTSAGQAGDAKEVAP